MVAKLSEELGQIAAEDPQAFKGGLISDVALFFRDQECNLSRILNKAKFDDDDKKAIEDYIKTIKDFFQRQETIKHFCRPLYWELSEEQKQLWPLYVKLHKSKLDYLLDEVISEGKSLLDANVRPKNTSELREKSKIAESLYSWLGYRRLYGCPYLVEGYRAQDIRTFFSIKEKL